MAVMMVVKKSLLFSVVIVVALSLAESSYGLSLKQRQPSSLHASTEPHRLTYHGGPLLTKSSTINVYLIWYGAFSQKDRAPITDFFASFKPSNGGKQGSPTVSKWWKTIQSYKDKAGKQVSGTISLAKQVNDKYSLGKKNIKRAQIANLVKNQIHIKILPLDPNGIYLVLTAKDVTVQRFCMSSCGFHDVITIATKSKNDNNNIVFGHVGDPSLQCPGHCAWPYALPVYGPPGKPLVAPNGVGADGVIINIATVLGGAATNPFKNGYYQGDALAPLEAGSACSGKFGAGAYSGFPGKLLVDKASNASYNAYGSNGRKFLLPAMWDIVGLRCKIVT